MSTNDTSSPPRKEERDKTLSDEEIALMVHDQQWQDLSHYFSTLAQKDPDLVHLAMRKLRYAVSSLNNVSSINIA